MSQAYIIIITIILILIYSPLRLLHTVSVVLQKVEEYTDKEEEMWGFCVSSLITVGHGGVLPSINIDGQSTTFMLHVLS